jgi:biopolymer transport protein ExbD
MAGSVDLDDDGEITSINVTPLVDITLVLLIVFMVTTTVITSTEGVEIDKPDAATGKQLEQTRLVVRCFADGRIAVEDADVPDDAALGRAIAAQVARDANVQGIVLCDTKAQAGTLMHIIDLMRAAGVKKYGVATEKPAGAPAAPAGR